MRGSANTRPYSDHGLIERVIFQMSAAHKAPRTIVFHLLPQFTLIAFSSAVEALRLANNVLGFNAYSWRFVSLDGENVTASCGLEIAVHNSIAVERSHLGGDKHPTMAIVCDGRNVERHNNKAAIAWLRESRHKGVALGSVCTGAFFLALSGLLDGKRCTIHWENYPGFVERFSNVHATTGIYEVDGGFYTCAGGTASFDMILHLVSQEFGDQVPASICDQALVERIRKHDDRQRLPRSIKIGTTNPIILKLVEKMEATLCEPMHVDDLASYVRLSRRQIERLFRTELKCSPSRYYMELRLELARQLLVQTAMPVVEVAIASGFVSQSHFSRCYREAFDYSPHEARLPHPTRSFQVPPLRRDPLFEKAHHFPAERHGQLA